MVMAKSVSVLVRFLSFFIYFLRMLNLPSTSGTNTPLCVTAMGGVALQAIVCDESKSDNRQLWKSRTV
jgi:hypothetical protein